MSELSNERHEKDVETSKNPARNKPIRSFKVPDEGSIRNHKPFRPLKVPDDKPFRPLKVADDGPITAPSKLRYIHYRIRKSKRII